MHALRRIGSLVAVSVTGTVLIVAGVIMLVTPGPGLLAIAAGLAVWAKEFQWARRLLDRARDRIARSMGRAPRRSSPPPRLGATVEQDRQDSQPYRAA